MSEAKTRLYAMNFGQYDYDSSWDTRPSHPYCNFVGHQPQYFTTLESLEATILKQVRQRPQHGKHAWANDEARNGIDVRLAGIFRAGERKYPEHFSSWAACRAHFNPGN